MILRSELLKTAALLMLVTQLALPVAAFSDPPAYWDNTQNGSGSTNLYAPQGQIQQPMGQQQYYQQQPNNGSFYAPANPTSVPTLQGYISTIPVGTKMSTSVSSYLSSANSQVGDQVSVTLGTDLVMGGQVVLPAGTQVQGQVVSVQPGKRLSRFGQIQMRFSRAQTPDGRIYPLSAKVITPDGTGIIKAGTGKDRAISGGKNVIGGAAVGAGIGLITGLIAGRGRADDLALRGALWGGGAGLAKSAWDRGEDVEIAPGTNLELMLDQTLSINQNQQQMIPQQQSPYNPYQPQQPYNGGVQPYSPY